MHIREEIRILKQLSNKFMIDFKEELQDRKMIYLVMEYISGGEMYHLIKEKKMLEQSWTQFYAAQVVLMIEYLHSMKIIYRDLKPENILISSNGYLKLIDFGLSKLTT